MESATSNTKKHRKRSAIFLQLLSNMNENSGMVNNTTQYETCMKSKINVIFWLQLNGQMFSQVDELCYPL